MYKELAISASLDYNKAIMNHISELFANYERIGYITLNKTYKALKQLMETYGIDVSKIYVIDLITPNIFRGEENEHCTYIDLNMLKISDFSEIIFNFVKQYELQSVIIDSLSSFLVYKQEEELTEFFNYLVSCFEELNVDVTFIALNEDLERKCIKQIKMVSDHTEMLQG